MRRKYRIKNTTGYSLNAFLDYNRAVDIIQHVLIGAEGALAFIAEAVLNTVPDLPVKYTGLLTFPDLYTAADSIVPLRQDRGQSAGNATRQGGEKGIHPTAGISPVHRSRYDRSKGKIVENEGKGKSGYTSECPQTAHNKKFQAEASEPLVGEGPH